MWCFFVRPLYELTGICQGYRASRRYISILNKKAVERFYDVTFKDGYCAYSDKPLSHLVEAVFTDEPYTPFYKRFMKNIGEDPKTDMPSCSIYDEPHTDYTLYPYIPWELDIPDKYRERYGRDIVLLLPDIFDETQNTKSARIDFYSLLSDMARTAFPEQLDGKLRREGAMLSGHYFAEEGFDYHPMLYGDLIEHLCAMGLPGCDSLWSDLDVLRHYVPCKLASSAAHLTLRDDVMIEASNMVDRDQNITLEKAKAAISVMFAQGVNVITSYYSENLFEEIKMREFAEHISSLSELFVGGRYGISTFLYYPFENLCADQKPMGNDNCDYIRDDHLKISLTAASLMKRQIGFDFINKDRLLSCELCDGYLVAPNGERVEHLVFPDIPWVDNELACFLNKASAKGVEVIFFGEKRDISNLMFTPTFVCDGYYPRFDIAIEKENPYILAKKRSFDGYDLFMLVNTADSDASIDVTINVPSKCKFAIVDHLTQEQTPIEPLIAEGVAHISLDINALDTVIIGRFE